MNTFSDEKVLFDADSEALSTQVATYDEKATTLTTKLESMVNDTQPKLVKRLIDLSGIIEPIRELVLEFATEIKVYTPERIEITWKYGNVFTQPMTISAE